MRTCCAERHDSSSPSQGLTHVRLTLLFVCWCKGCSAHGKVWQVLRPTPGLAQPLAHMPASG
jgi:hypothetical protein